MDRITLHRLGRKVLGPAVRRGCSPAVAKGLAGLGLGAILAAFPASPAVARQAPESGIGPAKVEQGATPLRERHSPPESHGETATVHPSSYPQKRQRLVTTVRTGPPVFAVFMVVSGAAGGACATLDESEAWRIRLCGMSVGYAIGGLVIGIITEAARSELKALDGARVGGEPGEAVPSAPRPDDLLLPRISVTAGPRAGGLELAWSF